MKPSAPSLQSTCLLDQVRECVLYNHYSLKKEKILLLLDSFFHPLQRHPAQRYATPAGDGGVHLHTQPSAQRPAVFVPRGAGHRFAIVQQHR